MSEFIPGSTGNVYKDIDGNDCSLFYLVNESPEWACSRIREGERAAAEVAALLEAISLHKKCILRSIGESITPTQEDLDLWAALQEKGE